MTKIGDLTGKKFGKLTVIGRDETRKNLSWLCKCECGNEVTLGNQALKTETRYIRSCGCSKEKNPNYITKNESEEELYEFDKLYEYVKVNVMGYKDSKLSNNMVLRLKGMKNGQFMRNKKANTNAHYSYETILNTFKFCVLDIKKALESKSFYTEEIKFNYICSIVESRLNTVAKRMESAKKAKKEAEHIDMSMNVNYKNNFKVKENNVNDNHKFDDLW